MISRSAAVIEPSNRTTGAEDLLQSRVARADPEQAILGMPT